jgi:hypothetical protein
MAKLINLVGQRFTRLTVMSFAGHSVGTNRQPMWWCRCDCDSNGMAVYGGNLRRGYTQSCGCLHSEISQRLLLRHGQAARVPVQTPEYVAWCSMLRRCFNPNVDNFYRYGAIGITVCDRWRTFENFYADMGDRPSPRHSLGRLLDMGNYEPGNVFWMTPKEQGLHRRNHNALNRWRKVA